PIKVNYELTSRFEVFRSATKTKIKAYRQLTMNCGTYMNRKACVCNQLSKLLQMTRDGKPARAQTFDEGGEFSTSADDACIRNKLPCTHIIDQDEGYALCFVPLPNVLEDGLCWKDLEFWVVE
ncbi:hypothetical protein CC86DRAFT_287961, partial [Ophiobolus disseminans]